jgi:hypothetical protein
MLAYRLESLRWQVTLLSPADPKAFGVATTVRHGEVAEHGEVRRQRKRQDAAKAVPGPA